MKQVSLPDKFLNFYISFVRFHFSSRGFTLIELLIVVLIIATLAVTVFVALNPAQRLKDSKNARRTSDVDTILTAIHAYIIDNGGFYPAGLSAGMAETMIGTGAACTTATSFCTTGAACVNLGTATTLGKYLKTIPIDPIAGTTYTAAKTGYDVQVDTAGVITVKACGSEGTTLIQSSR